MRKLLFFILFLLAIHLPTVHAQGLPIINTELSFRYDAAGNQYLRYFDFTKSSEKSTEEETQEDISEEIPKDINSNSSVNVYPNPVEDELSLSWSGNFDNYIKSIQIFTLGSILIENRVPPKTSRHYVIRLNKYPSGIYIVSVLFNNGKQEVFKIIKK